MTQIHYGACHKDLLNNGVPNKDAPDSSIFNYSHVVTTKPHDIRRVFVSDLHLSSSEPALVQAFLALLNDLIVLPNLHELYILGDWFDVWVGDDVYLSLTADEKLKHWLTPMITKLKALRSLNCQIFVMHGNRDFLIRQAFCDSFGGQLIQEPCYLTIGRLCYRLEHGDALCSDDISYQRYRKVMRNPVIQWALLKRPIDKRLKLAQNIRQKSTVGKVNKSPVIMDVNPKAVNSAIHDVDNLLHGHTHRPAIHEVTTNKTRYVLGDWRLLNPQSSRQKVQAVIGVSRLIQNQTTSSNQDIDDMSSTLLNHTEVFNLVNFEF